MSGQKSDYENLEQINKGIREFGSELQKIYKNQFKNIDKLSDKQKLALSSTILAIKNSETSIKYLKEQNELKLNKLKLDNIRYEKEANLTAENAILDLKIRNIEIEAEKKAEALHGYEKDQQELINKRSQWELDLITAANKKRAEMGVAESKSFMSRMAEVAAYQENKPEHKNATEKGQLFGKESTISQRMVALGTMFTTRDTKTGKTHGLADVVKQRKTNNLLAENKNEIQKARDNGTLKKAQDAQKELNEYKKNIKEGKADFSIEKLHSLQETLTNAINDTGLPKNVVDIADEEINPTGGTNDELSAILKNGVQQMVSALADLYDKLSDTADQIALNKSTIDGRLQGATTSWSDISDAVASTMLDGSVRSENVANNIYAAVKKGIARDVEAMGAIETIKDRVAPTFDTFNNTVLRLIKLQNQNTTYARMGMEASLTQLFNQLYQTTEYLNSLASSVRSNLEEAEALMGGVEAVDFEYQVQKWLGSLSSAGMSDSAVTAISDAFGKLAAGQIEGITEGGAGNLMVMAANNANLSIADILADGLDASETNQLMNAMVNYMKELVSEASGNNVVQQQLAKVFGVSASDLNAAVNIMTTYGDTQSELLKLNNTYGNFLYSAANSGGEVTLAERLSNMWANAQYSIATEIANSPVLYALTKVTTIMDSLVDGIDIPTVSIHGYSVDLKTSVSEIMKSASLVTAAIKTVSASLAGGGFNAAQQLASQGSGSSVKISAGTATSSSGSGQIYNSSVEDMESSATAESSDQSKKLTVQAKEEDDEVSEKTINNNIVSIYNIIKNVVDGDELFHVKMAGGANGGAETMKVEVVNYDQFASGRYSWNEETSTLTDTWADTGITNWTNPAAI